MHLRRALGAADRAPGGALGAAGTADVDPKPGTVGHFQLGSLTKHDEERG